MKNQKSILKFTVLAALPLAVACTTFDEKIDLSADTPDAAANLLVDSCQDVTAIAMPIFEPVTATLMGYTSEINNLSTCNIAAPATGPDGFFSFSALAGERWHIMARPMDADNRVRVAILDACDDRSCVQSADNCHEGEPEHMNFTAPTGGEYIVAIDADKMGMVMVMAMKPPCGDGNKQHGETCDDNNAMDGDGCSSTCQAEILTAEEDEQEPNDGFFESNIILMDTPGMVTMKGQSGGACEIDRFTATVPENGSLTVDIKNSQGEDCGSEVGEMSLMILDENGAQLAKEEMLGGCPSFLGEGLSAGDYQMVLETHSEEGQEVTLFSYQMEITVAAAL